MTTPQTKAIIDAAKNIYDSRLRVQLEQSDSGRYLAIEPTSGEHFLADTFDNAVNAALERYPDRLTHTIRIGHAAAMHLGVLVR
jgi:hypothetical protein